MLRPLFLAAFCVAWAANGCCCGRRCCCCCCCSAPCCSWCCWVAVQACPGGGSCCTPATTSATTLFSFAAPAAAAASSATAAATAACASVASSARTSAANSVAACNNTSTIPRPPGENSYRSFVFVVYGTAVRLNKLDLLSQSSDCCGDGECQGTHLARLLGLTRTQCLGLSFELRLDRMQAVVPVHVSADGATCV